MNISIIDMPIFYGCDRIGVENGPKVLRENNLINIFEKHHNVYDMGEVHIENILSLDKYKSSSKMKYLKEIVDSNNNLAKKVYEALENSTMPIVIGGDHSLALGSIAGSSKFFNEDIAVIWIDAHGDLNTSETSPTGNIHGMPLAASLNIGDDNLTNIHSNNAKLKPENVFLLGCRDLDEGELKLLDELDINIWTMEDIKDLGINNVIKELLNSLHKKGIKNIHLSFDIDSLDPSYVPGTGTPVESGLTFSEGKLLIESILNTSLVKCIDFVEFNPDIDNNSRTLETCIELLNIISNGLNFNK